jgi:hypothetical protein
MTMTMTQFLQPGGESFSEDQKPVSAYEREYSGEPPVERWPVLVRVLVIAGLSLALWSGIIWGLTRIF